MLRRRSFLAASAAGAGSLLSPATAGAHPGHGNGVVPDPRGRFGEPVVLTGFETVRLGGVSMVRATAAVAGEPGAVGVTPAPAKLADVRSLFDSLAAPFFTGKDARDLPELVHDVYADGRNYKYAGMPFWLPVAACELAAWDLLGRLAGVSCGELLTLKGVPRRRLKVYISRFDRDTTPRRAVAAAAADLEATGARAVKLKVGRRMSTTPDQNARDLATVKLARQTLGDGVEILLDANGSYSEDEAVRAGTLFADHGVGFLEEPCPWQDWPATAAVRERLDAKNVRLALAGGEQDASMPQWRWYAANGVFDPVQPDLFYNGGAVRLLTVARHAAAASLKCTPHAPRAGLESYADLVVRAAVPNLGPFQEYRRDPGVAGGTVAVPDGPGWGLPFSDAEVRAAT